VPARAAAGAASAAAGPNDLPIVGTVISKAEMYTDIVDLYRMDSLAGIGGRVISGIGRTIMLILGMTFSSMRGLGSGYGRGGNPRNSEVVVQVRNFRVQVDGGPIRECVLRGVLRGGFVEIGDRVRVEGRLYRRYGATVHVSRIVNLLTQQRISAILPARLRYAKARAVIGVAIGLLVLYFLFSACMGLGRR
jgi:hypothetical protein